jgi:putative endonuclease
MRTNHVYILECVDGTYYVGSTTDLEARLYQHETGEGANYTKRRRPVRLVYAEQFDRIDEAFAREKQLQRWGHAKRKALIAGQLGTLSVLARGRDRDR